MPELRYTGRAVSSREKTGFTTADCRLQRIYDAEGKVLYRNDSDFWTAEESEYVPMLKEGRIWVWNAVDLRQRRDDIPVYLQSSDRRRFQAGTITGYVRLLN